MNNQSAMPPAPAPDLNRVFEFMGGFGIAAGKLRAYAIYVIKKRSSLTKNGRAVSNLDAWQLVRNALARLTEMESLDNGKEVYFQLRRHIDNEVHTLQKKRTPDPLFVAIATGTPTEGSPEVAEPEDCTATDVADAAERSAEDDFYRDLLRDLQKGFKANSADSQLVGHILDGWSERREIAELMGITPEQYDTVYKRVARAALALKENTLKRTET
jgi:hypothetical protein